MPVKEKFLGLILILLGAFPFLLKVDKIGLFFSKYKFLNALTPGEIIYQIAIIFIGIMLIWKVKPRIEAR